MASSPATPSSSQSWAPQARNPVAMRLYKVLGTNFEDVATRDALRTLSELYASPSKAHMSGKDRDIDRDSDEDDSDDEHHHKESALVLGVLTNLPEGVPGDAAAKARKNLRRDMENKLAEGSRQFLDAFGEVDKKLDELQGHIAEMRLRCDDADTQLQLTQEASKTLLERASSLREERKDVENQKAIINLFLSRFTLDDSEVEAITSRDVPVGSTFFAAMDKTERIRNDCRVLMSGEDGPTKAGLDIMSSTSLHLEQGYEKILRWLSFEFRQMGREVQIEASSTMREAVRRLRQRPELLSEALTLLAQTRQSALSRAFLDALTRGGPGGLPRPIELHAPDALRYTGDMLAWVHQAVAAERELLEGLFAMGPRGRMVGSVRRFEESEEEEWIKELMDGSVMKLCTPLKVRVLQALRTQESSFTSYKIANLLQFYLLTMRRTIGTDALVTKTLQEITDVSYKLFFDAVEAQGRALLRVSLALDDPELTPPAAVLDHAQNLRELMTVYDSSLLGDEPEAERSAGFARILDVFVGPAIEMCSNAAEEKKRLRPTWDKEVFVLNYLTYLQGVLEPFSFTMDKRAEIQTLIDERTASLTDEHFANILKDASLSEAVDVCESNKADEPLSRIPGMQPQQLQVALRGFSQWLSGLEVVQSPRLARLTVQRLHTRVHHAALARLAKAYRRLCDEVKKSSNKYEAASTLLGSERPFGQVHLLWQIFGLQEEERDAR